MSDAESLLFYTKNLKDALSAGPAQVEAVMQDIADTKPDVLFFSEAYKIGTPAEPLENVADRLRTQGYEVLFGPYSERRKDRHGLLAGALRERLYGGLELVHYAGRGAVLMTLAEPKTGRPMHVLGMHGNDRQLARNAETDAIIEEHGPWIAAGRPFALIGDRNASLNKSPFTILLRVGGFIAKVATRLGVVRESVPGEDRQSTIGRIASLFIRGAAQASGEDIRRFTAAGLAEADPLRQPTALVPELPQHFAHMLRRVGAVARWLDQPHLQNDHILGAGGSFTSFTVHPRQPSDDHHGISAVFEANNPTKYFYIDQ